MEHPGLYSATRKLPNHAGHSSLHLAPAVKEVRNVIRSLTQGTPDEQQDAVYRYFLPGASFMHPFCRVPSFVGLKVPGTGELDSRALIVAILKWCKFSRNLQWLPRHSNTHPFCLGQTRFSAPRSSSTLSHAVRTHPSPPLDRQANTDH